MTDIDPRKLASEATLKPCMRCGSVHILTPQSASDDDIIICLDCGYSTKWQNGHVCYENSARGVWDDQPYADALRAELAAAQARVKRLEEATLRLMNTQMQPSWTDEDEYDHELKEALANCRAALAEKP